MIDFSQDVHFYSKLHKVNDNTFGKAIDDFLISGENIIGTYQNIRDGVVFTNKRIITVNVQGITGKKKDFTCIPYSKITTFSVETAGLFDFDANLEIYLAAVGKVKFEFTGSTDVKEICKMISDHALV